MMDLADRIRSEADIADRPGQYDRLYAIADELAAHDAKVWDDGAKAGQDSAFLESDHDYTDWIAHRILVNPYRHSLAGVWDVEQAKETPMSEFQSINGKQIRGWAVMGCTKSAPHDPHSWNALYLVHGPYTCPGIVEETP